jgi:D-serine dehydratase
MHWQDEPIDDRTKGIPGGTEPFRVGDIAAKRWNVLREDLSLPLAVLKQSTMDGNARWMARFVDAHRAVLCPHGKTTMSPALFAQQRARGAWGITVATVQQLQVCRDYGFSRVLLANQLIGKQAIRYVLDELQRDPEFAFLCLADSVEGVRRLADAAAARGVGRPIEILVEGGYAGGRTGCRDGAQALAVARAVAGAAPHLALRGVEGFEGLIAGPPAERDARVAAFVDSLVQIVEACAREDLFADGPVIVSAGGSAFFDLCVKRLERADPGREVLMVTRSGCYLTHDSLMYSAFFRQLLARSPEVAALGEGLRPALEVWGYVQSTPEPELALLTMGRRDISHDADMPKPEQWFRPGAHDRPRRLGDGYAATRMDDQHLYLKVPDDSPLGVGDMVAFGISHPCTTFDKWRLIPVVNDDYDVVDAVTTYF